MKLNIMRRMAFLSLLLFIFSIANIGAQNLLTDNPHTIKARELRRQADAAMEAGEYTAAIALAEEIDAENQLALVWAENQAWAFRANSMRRLANEQVARVKAFNAAAVYPAEHEAALAELALGEAAFIARDWQLSFGHFSTVRNSLTALRAPTAAGTGGKPALPKYYTVRQLVGKSDSFWRIASYDFVYGDGRLWPRLYAANKHILRNPDNPNLIHPGMRFVIPPLTDEAREGDWQP